MVLARSAERRPPGPDAPVRLGIDADTLPVLESARRKYGDIVAFRTESGRSALFVNDPAEIRQLLVRRHAKYRLLTRKFSMSRTAAQSPALDPGINLRSQSDIRLEPALIDRP